MIGSQKIHINPTADDDLSWDRRLRQDSAHFAAINQHVIRPFDLGHELHGLRYRVGDSETKHHSDV